MFVSEAEAEIHPTSDTPMLQKYPVYLNVLSPVYVESQTPPAALKLEKYPFYSPRLIAR